MPVSQIHRFDKIICASLGEFIACENITPATNITPIIERATGEIVPYFTGTDRISPGAAFSTTQLDVLLGMCPFNGIKVTGNTDLFWKLATAVGNAARDGSHQRLRMTDVVMWWTQIRLPSQGRATVDVNFAATWDGTNDPYVFSGQALSGTISADNLNYFQCGPASLNGTSLGAVQEIVIESGAQMVPEYADGEQAPTFIRIDQVAPAITIQTIGSTGWDVPGGGTALNGSAGLTCYARRMLKDGQRASTNHISFVMPRGIAKVMQSQASGTGAIIDTIRVEGRTNGTAAAMTVATNATIS